MAHVLPIGDSNIQAAHFCGSRWPFKSPSPFSVRELSHNGDNKDGLIFHVGQTLQSSGKGNFFACL